MLLGGDYVTAIKLDTRFAQTRDYFCFLHILLSVEADAKIDTRIRDTMFLPHGKLETVYGYHDFVNCLCFVVNKFAKALFKMEN